MTPPEADGSTPLPFGLLPRDLAVALPGVTGPTTVIARHRAPGRDHGGHASAVLEVVYPTSSGPARTCLFVKQNRDRPEGLRYRYLADRGVPLPKLHAAVARDDAEVLLLEHLPVIGLDRADVEAVLDMLARLASLQDVPARLVAPPAGTDQATFEVSLAAALDRVDREHRGQGTARWLATYRELLPRYRDLPTALTHGELAPHQFGRTDGGRLVVFDLATLGRRPRFFDLAAIVGGLADLSGRSERAILIDHLSRVRRLGVDPGPAPGPVQGAWDELLLTRFVGLMETVPWLVGQAADGARESTQALARHLRTTAAVHAGLVDATPAEP